MLRLSQRDFVGLNIVKLKGHSNVFCIKHGRLRIIFSISNEKLLVLQVGLRSENTYSDF